MNHQINEILYAVMLSPTYFTLVPAQIFPHPERANNSNSHRQQSLLTPRARHHPLLPSEFWKRGGLSLCSTHMHHTEEQMLRSKFGQSNPSSPAHGSRSSRRASRRVRQEQACSRSLLSLTLAACRSFPSQTFGAKQALLAIPR